MPKHTSARGRLEASVCGERVRIALMEARPAGLTFKQLMQATGLSAHHTRKGINYVEDTAALEHLTPLTWDIKNGYRFPVNVADWIVYELAAVETLFNRAARVLTSTIAPHAAARPGPARGRVRPQRRRADHRAQGRAGHAHDGRRQPPKLIHAAPPPWRAAMRRRRYPLDTTAAEWGLIEPLLPPPACSTALGGRPEKHPRREIVDAIRYFTDNGCKWRALPADFPPWQTVYDFFARWSRAGVITAIRDALREQVRARAGRCRAPVAAIVDSQTVKAAETVARSQRGYDPAKKINGRKRHVVVDLGGLPLVTLVTPADRSDLDIARDLLVRLRIRHPQLTIVWADTAYSGALVGWADRFLHLTIKTVARPAGQPGFVVLPRRWVVERSLAWMMRARRNCRDYERLPGHSEAFLNWTAITLMTRRLTRKRPSRPRAVSPALAA